MDISRLIEWGPVNIVTCRKNIEAIRKARRERHREAGKHLSRRLGDRLENSERDERLQNLPDGVCGGKSDMWGVAS